MEILFDMLKATSIQTAIFVMDYVKHHQTKPSDIPKGETRKDALSACAKEKNIKIPEKPPKSKVWNAIKKYAAQNVLPVIYQMAKDVGHELLYSPPHHSELQPIELV